MSQAVGRLLMERPAARWRDFFRAYLIEIDGTAAFVIHRGEHRLVELPPGPHLVRARIAWTGSPEVKLDLVAGEVLRCRVQPAGSGFALWQIIGHDRYLSLEPSS